MFMAKLSQYRMRCSCHGGLKKFSYGKWNSHCGNVVVMMVVTISILVLFNEYW